MKFFHGLIGLILLAAASAVFFNGGCVKKFSVAPVSAFPATPTPTPTSPPVFTATPTPSAIACSPSSYQLNYSFESDAECWHVSSNTYIVTSLDISATQTNNGSAGALQVSIENTVEALCYAEVELVFATPQNMSYALITLSFYVDPGLALDDWTSNIQLFDVNNGDVFENAYYYISSGSEGNTGKWQSMGMVVGLFYGSDATQVSRIGVRLSNIPAGGSGSLYIDDVSITFLPTPTPTPVATCAAVFQPVYTFDSSLECWHVDATSLSVVTGLDIASSPARKGTGSMRAAISQPSEPVSVFLELQYSTPQSLVDKSFIFWVYVDPSFAGCVVQGFVQSGSSWHLNTGGWTEFNSENTGRWVPIQFVSCFCGGNANEVQQIGIQIFNMPPSASGNIYVDDYQVVPYLCTAFSVQPAYTFESSFDCWHPSFESLPAVNDFDLSSAQAHEGTSSLRASIAEPSAPIDVQFDLNYNWLSLNGMTVGFWTWVDPGLSGCSAEIYTISGGSIVRNSGGATAFDSSHTGQWVFISWTPPFDQPGEDAAQVTRIGIRFFNMPAGAAGDLYLDDMTIQ